MPLIEWNTPLINPVAAFRLLQDAANMLNYHEFTAVMPWPEDGYALAKFRQFQELGRLISYFDNNVLRQATAEYQRLADERARFEEEPRYGTDRCAWPRCWVLRMKHEGLDHNFVESSTGDGHDLDSCNRCGAWRMYHEPGHPDHDASDACEDFEEPGDCPNCHLVNDGRHAVGCPESR